MSFVSFGAAFLAQLAGGRRVEMPQANRHRADRSVCVKGRVLCYLLNKSQRAAKTPAQPTK